jgi:hypothetical protein
MRLAQPRRIGSKRQTGFMGGCRGEGLVERALALQSAERPLARIAGDNRKPSRAESRSMTPA